MLTPSNSSTSEHTLRVTVQRKFGGFYLVDQAVTLVIGETKLTAQTDRYGVAVFRFPKGDDVAWVEAQGKRLGPAPLSWKQETNLRYLV